MHKALIIGGIILTVFIVYYGISFYRHLLISKSLVAQAEPYQLESTDDAITLLILGDSTAVGVGASRKEDSVPGRFAAAIEATYTENHAVSGATVSDLSGQIAQASRSSYDYILIHIGGNDIIRLKTANSAAAQLDEALKTLPQSSNVFVLSAGNVGAVPFFPWFTQSFYTARTLAFHTAFTKTVTAHNGTYVNLYIPEEEDPFSQEPDTYLSADGLHPSSAGYALWFETLMRYVHR